MATATKPPIPASTSKFRPWPMTADFYERMIEAGVFTRKERVWLWKGQLVQKMTKGHPHTVALSRLDHVLGPLAVGTGQVVQEGPMRLLQRDDTIPEPDLKVIRGHLGDYATTPTSREVPLVIEVADSSLAEDRTQMLKLYAAEAIPVYWIVNVVDRQIENYSMPTGLGDGAGYSITTIYRPGQQVPVVLDGNEVGRVAVGAIFPENDPWL